MDFPKVLKRKQLEMGMTVVEFAKHLGKSRQFLTVIYSRSDKLKKYKLSDLTMYGLETKLGISPELMEEYNDYVREHNGRIKKSESR
jgi:hypothetical protein